MSSRVNSFLAAILALAACATSVSAEPATSSAPALPKDVVIAVAMPGTEAATGFLKRLASGDIDGVYAQASEPFRRKFTAERFKAIVEPLVKAGMKQAAWQNGKVIKTAVGYSTDIGFYSNRTIMKIKGSLATVHAGLVDIEMTLVQTEKGFDFEGFDFKTRPGTAVKPIDLQPAERAKPI